MEIQESYNKEEYKKAEVLIDASYIDPGKATIEPALQTSLKFFVENSSKVHFFCNPKMIKIVMTTLLIFAYSGSQHQEVFSKYLRRNLECPKCARRYPYIIKQFEKVLKEKYVLDHDTVNHILELIFEYNNNRLVQNLNLSIETFRTDPPDSVQINSYLSFINELISYPKYLNDIKTLELFRELFFMYDKAGVQISSYFSYFSPLLIKSLFEFNTQFQEWAHQTLKEYRGLKSLKGKDFDEMIVTTLEEYFNKKDSNLNNNLLSFCSALNELILSTDKSVFIDNLPQLSSDMFSILTDVFFRQKHSIIAIELVTLGSALKKLGPQFWQIVKTVTPDQLLKAIIDNETLLENEVWRSSKTFSQFKSIQRPTDMIQWVLPFCISDSENHVRCALAFIPIITSKIINKEDSINADEDFMVTLVSIFSYAMKLNITEKVPFVDVNELGNKFKVRQCIGKLSKLIINSYKLLKSSSSQYSSCMEKLLRTSIFSDIVSGLFVEAPDNITVTDTFWSYILKNSDFDSEIISSALKTIAYSSFIRQFSPEEMKSQNINLSEHVKINTVATLKVFSSLPPEIILQILEDDVNYLSILLNMCSSDTTLQEGAKSVLLNGYTSQDNIYAIFKIIFSNKTKRAIKLANELTQVIKTSSSFLPVPMYLEMNTIFYNVLLNEINLEHNHFSKAMDNELYVFWKETWKMARHICLNVRKWASTPSNIDFVNFIGSLIRYIAMLINGVNQFLAIFPTKDFGSVETAQIIVLRDIVDSIPDLLILVRLKDKSMLEKSLPMMHSIFALLNKHKYPAAELLRVHQILQMMNMKVKPYSNILSKEQLKDLLEESRTPETKIESLGSEVKSNISIQEFPSILVQSMKDISLPQLNDFSHLQSTIIQSSSDSSFQLPNNENLPTSQDHSKRSNNLRPSIARELPNKSDPIALKQIGIQIEKQDTNSIIETSKIDLSTTTGIVDNIKSHNNVSITTLSSSHSLSNGPDVSSTNAESNLTTIKTNIEEKKQTVSVITKDDNKNANSSIEKKAETSLVPAVLNEFMKEVLTWDYFSSSGSPTYMNKKRPNSYKNISYSIPLKFPNISAFKDFYKPLVFLKFWNKIQSTKKIVNTTNSLFKIETSKLLRENAYFVTGTTSLKTELIPTHLYLLSYTNIFSPDTQTSDINDSYCLVNIAITDKSARTSTLNVTAVDPSQKILQAFQNNTILKLYDVGDYTQFENEFQSVNLFNTFPNQEDIIKRTVSISGRPRPLLELISSRMEVTVMQASAIVQSHKLKGISVIDG